MYRVVRWLVAAAISTPFMLVQPSLAGQPAAVQAVTVADVSLLQASGLTSTFAAFLDSRLAGLVATTKDAQHRAWLAQLKSFYASRSGAPVWISAKGFNAAAALALTELSRADDWGLDPNQFERPVLTDGGHDPVHLVDAEIAMSQSVVKYASHANGGRIAPYSLSLWLDGQASTVYATAVMIEIISAKDAGAALRDMHPKSEAFERLRQAYVSMRNESAAPKSIDPKLILANGQTIKTGQWHPDVAILRNRLKVPAVAGFETQFDEKLANAVDDFLDRSGVRVRWGIIDDRVRREFNRPPPPPSMDDMARLLANMERWRWLPRDLGRLHIWNNLTEQMTRVVKDGQVIHEERIIVGQPHTQTPVFSETMKSVVFQPEWGVPPSIKITDLLPKFQSGDFDVLERRDMRIIGLSGKELKPQRFNWDKTDIRDVGIYQRAGDGNPLGYVKFLFPNNHHVYMHDTNARSLFTAAERTFSHGCIRVRNPKRLAEIVLGEDKGWDADDVERMLKDRKKPNNKVELDRPIPVHNVYFTLIPGDGNTLIRLDDMYGHDKRVTQALSGVPAVRIAENDPALNQQREMDEAAPPLVRREQAAAERRRRQSQDDDDN